MTATAKDALLICEAVGGAVVLGGKADPKQAFSSVEGDNFIAPNWEVLSTVQTRRLTAFTSNVPKPLTDQRGEAIAMIFEDAVELVFWNGRQYRHAPAEF